MLDTVDSGMPLTESGGPVPFRFLEFPGWIFPFHSLSTDLDLITFLAASESELTVKAKLGDAPLYLGVIEVPVKVCMARLTNEVHALLPGNPWNPSRCGNQRNGYTHCFQLDRVAQTARTGRSSVDHAVYDTIIVRCNFVDQLPGCTGVGTGLLELGCFELMY